MSNQGHELILIPRIDNPKVVDSRLLTDLSDLTKAVNAQGGLKLDITLDPKATEKIKKQVSDINDTIKSTKAKSSPISEDSLARVNQQVEVLRSRIDKAKTSWSQMFSNPEIVTRIREIESELEKVNGDKTRLQSLQREWQVLSNRIGEAGLNTKNFGDRVTETFSRLSAYLVNVLVIGTITRSLKSALNDLKEIDDQLTQISKVTDLVRENFKQASLEAIESANRWGRTATDYLEAVKIFAQAGATNYEDLANLSVLAQSAGDMTADLASDYLVATNAAFELKYNISELTKVLDGQNNISNKSAVTMTEMAMATKNYANTAAVAGESAASMSAMITAGVASTTKPGEEVGRALRTLTMNIRQIKGETEDGIIDEESMGKAEKALNSINIQTRYIEEGMAKLKTPSAVLGELAAKYEAGAISAEKLAIILEDVGSKRQADILAAMVKNWGLFEKAMVDFSEGTGTAAIEAQKDLESWNGKLNRLSNTWTGFIAKTVDVEWIKISLDGLTGLINLVDNLGNAITLAAGALLIFKRAAVASGFEMLKSQALNAVNAIKALYTGILALIPGTKAHAAAQVAANTAMKAGTVSATALSAAVGGLLIVIPLLISAYNKYKQGQEEAKQRVIELSQAMHEHVAIIDDMKRKVSDEGLTRESLIGLMGSHNEKYEEELAVINDVNAAREKAIQLLDDEARQRAQDTVNETGSQYIEQRAFLETPNYAPLGDAPIIGTPQDVLDQLSNSLAIYQEKIASGVELSWLEEKALKALEEAYSETSKKIADATATIEAYDLALSILNGTYSVSVDKAEEASESVAASAVELFNNISDLRKGYEQGTVKSDDYVKSLQQQLAEIEALIASNPKLASGYKMIADILRNSIATAPEALRELRNVTVSIIDSAYTLSDAFKEQSENGNLSFETTLKIIDAGYAAALSIDTETGAVTLNEAAYIALAQAKIEERQVSLSISRSALVSQLGEEQSAVNSLTQAYEALGIEAINAALKAAKAKQTTTEAEIKAQETEIAFLNDLLQNSSKVTSGSYTKSSSKSGGSSSSKKETDTHLEAYKTLVKDIQYLRDMDIIDEAEYYKRLEALANEYLKGRAKYLDEYRKVEVELHNFRKKLLEDQRKAEIKAAEDSYKAQKEAAEDSYKAQKKAAEDAYNAQRKALENQRDLLNDQLDAYKKLIDYRKQLLKREGDAHDFDNEVAESNKRIAELQAQIEALSLDDSAKANAKRLELTEQLNKEKSDLEEKQYDRSIDLQDQALDDELSRYQDHINSQTKLLDDQLKALKDSHDRMIDNMQASHEAMLSSLEASSQAFIQSIESKFDQLVSEAVSAANQIAAAFEYAYAKGQGSAAIMQAQQQLVSGGYDVGKHSIDGKWGPDTEKAYIYRSSNVNPEAQGCAA